MTIDETTSEVRRSRDEQGVRSLLPVASDLLLLGARLYAGITIARAGFVKIPTPQWMIDQVGEIGLIPFPRLSATLACLSEFIAGVLLAIGLLSRPAAAVLAVILGVASFGYHRLVPLVDMHIAQGFFWLFLALLSAGPGRFSLDCLLDRLRRAPAAGAGRPWLRPALIAAPLLALLGFALATEFSGARPDEERPRIESVHLAGSFNDWSLDATPLTKTGESTWSADVKIEREGQVAFKFVGNSDWSLALGTKGARHASLPARGTGDPRGEDIQVVLPGAGTFRWTVDVSSYEYSVSAIDEAKPAPVGD